MQEQYTELAKPLELIPVIDTIADQDPSLWYKSLLTTLTDIHTAASAMAKEVAIVAVEEGALTRRAAAEAIDVHPITISRWVTAHEAERPQ